MAYQVLARKWRPQSFEQLRGQAHIARALSNAIASGRISHAYLFTGIRGVGKTSAARVLAKALNCVEGPTPTPCNRCDSCREITDGRSSDVLEIDGASNTGVDDVRRLREAVRYPAVRGPYRVYIIDEVHMLSTQAFNALLKTLEEPPEHVVFVFATTDAHKIPVTILSRCQQFDFKRLAPRELTRLLGDVAAAEGVTLDERSLATLAREADGSVRDGQSLLDQVISYAGSTVRYEDVRDVLGVVDRELLLRVARAVVEGDGRAVLETLGEAEQFGFDVRRFALDLLDVFRDLAVLQGVSESDELVELTTEEATEAREFCADASWEKVHALFDMLARGVDHLRSAARPGVVLEMTLLKMSRLPPLLSLAQVLAGAAGVSVPPAQVSSRPRLERSWEQPAPRAAPVARSVPLGRVPAAPPGSVAEPAPPEQPQPRIEPPTVATTVTAETSATVGAATLLDVAGVWRGLLAWAEDRSRPLWSVLSVHAKLAAWDGDARVARIAYDDPNCEFGLRNKQELLAEYFSSLTRGPVQVEFECTGTRAGRPDLAKDGERARQLRKETQQHPLVRRALELFDGDLEEVRGLK